MSLVSIITPTYNRAYILAETAKSIFSQTDANWEWVIVDDGSTDNTRELVGSWSRQNITYICQDNAGPAAARNTGLKRCTGDLIAYIDSDNELAANYVERLLHYSQQNPQGLYFVPKANRTKEYYKDGALVDMVNESASYPEEATVLDFVHRNIKFDGNGFAHSKIVLEHNISWDERLKMIEDFDFFLSVANEFPDSFVYIPEYLVNYHMRFGGDSLISNAKMSDHADAYEYVYQKHKNDTLMPGQNWYPSQVEKYKKVP